ncbi:MAG: zinc ABC transporter substrate-binding protein, partial [Elusimicrobia bacterium]|nr:zinc ABC transporter substrate-binding protein [Elusimicrobiota bacterium]
KMENFMLKKMKFAPLFLAAFLCAAVPGAWAGRLRVLATTDYIAALAKAVGGDKVSVDYLSPAGFDADGYSPRPQDIFKVHQAQLFLMIGLNLEDWARDVVNAANNPHLIKAQIYHGIKLLDKPTGPINYSFGDIHPYGNPHFQTDPEDGGIMAKNIYQALVYADPSNQAYYAKNLADFEARLTKAAARWRAELAPYKGDAILPYHESWHYFAEAFGFVDPNPPFTIEEKPGFVPSPRRIEDVIQDGKAAHVKLVITEPYYDVSIGQAVAKGIGAPCVVISLYGIGANPKETDYISMMNVIVGKVAEALKEGAAHAG